MEEIYLDNNATTKTHDSVLKAMLPFLTNVFGNESSAHTLGRQAKQAISTARNQVASLLNANPNEIYFTSGGTESNNLCLWGLAEFLLKSTPVSGTPIHFITSSIEHPSVFDIFKALESDRIQVTYLPVNAEGCIEIDAVQSAIQPHTKLISIMHANNEVGTIQPLKKIANLAAHHAIYFHSDAVQSVGKLDINLNQIRLSYLSLAAHKFYGPKGVGALYIRHGCPKAGIYRGGKQENGLRPGTLNTAGIVGLGKACELASSRLANSQLKSMTSKRNQLRAGLEILPGVSINGSESACLANTVHASFCGHNNQEILIALDRAGIFVSTGSACGSGTPQPSKVLLAMNKTPEEISGAIRFSLSVETTSQQIEKTISTLKSILSRLG